MQQEKQESAKDAGLLPPANAGRPWRREEAGYESAGEREPYQHRTNHPHIEEALCQGIMGFSGPREHLQKHAARSEVAVTKERVCEKECMHTLPEFGASAQAEKLICGLAPQEEAHELSVIAQDLLQ